MRLAPGAAPCAPVVSCCWLPVSCLRPGPSQPRSPPPEAAAFPRLGILPKAETGAIRLLEKHADYDGRGIVVAIFDTGVDPGAAGLQVTTDGKPKVIDVVDGSGSGDVDTSTVREAKDGKLEALSGRTLTIPGGWKNPKGKWHVGIKRAYDLYPGGLVRRLKTKRRKKWDERHRRALVSAREAVEAAEDGDAKADERKELKRRLALLTEAGEAYEDPGPILDVVAFHDGEAWQAVIDTDEDGALDDEKVMTNYRAKRQWGTFSDEDLLNYALNIYEDGNVVSIVVDVGAHGTHVAGIVAAHFPDRPELNGIAPGAQIVSVKIGDTRQDSSSMGTGEERGIVAVLRNKCHLINQSYGGASPSPNRTRQDTLFADVVNKHGVIFVASAGNDGPCLSTVGSPGGTNAALFGVGAYVSPAMMKAQFAMRESVPATHFTWSARGPTLDGALGVDFSAPGGAIAPVPTWSLQGLTQMNGTSMSAPNLCGNIALLLSGMKAESIPASPHRIRRALTNTAADIPTLRPFGQGAGLIQVDKALAYVRTHKDRADEDVRYDVRVLSAPGGRGIYLREPHDLDRPREFRVFVDPKLHEDADHRRRVQLDQRIRLVATQPWIDVADHLLLTHGGRRFDVRVDPTAVSGEGAHFGWVEGHDARVAGRGPLFRIPVTVVKPMARQDEAGARYRWHYDTKPGAVQRHFVVPPEGATWADIRLRAGKQTTSKVYVLQCVQLLPGRSYQSRFLEEYVRLDEGEDVVYSIDVEPGRVLEVALAQYWSSLEDGQCEIAVSFHGLVPEPREVTIANGARLRTVDVSAPFERTRLGPSGTLETLRRLVAPASGDVQPLDPGRDLLPREKLAHELILTYEVELEDEATVRPRGPMEFVDVIWEDWASGLWMLTDENDRKLAGGPIWEDDEWVTLPKGTYTVQAHLRHDDPDFMKRWTRAPMALEFKIDPIGVDVHANPRERSGVGNPEMAPGERRRLFVYAPGPDDLPDIAQPGDLLVGEIHFGAKQPKRFGAGRRPGGWPVHVVVPPFGDEEDDDEDEDDSDDDAPEPSTAEVLRDAKVDQLATLRDDEERAAFDLLAAEILKDFPDHLPVLVEQLKMLDGDGPPHDGGAASVLAAAARVLAVVDAEAVAAHFGVKHDEKMKGEDKREHEKFVAQRAALREALFRIARIAEDPPVFDRNYTLLKKWVDIGDEKYAALRIRDAKLKKEWGRALQTVNDAVEAEPTKRKHHEARIEILEKLGWSHLLEAERAWLPLRFPETTSLF